jgi:hypothetical protein
MQHRQSPMKSISVHTLQRILAKLPPNAHVVATQNGNLTIYAGDRDAPDEWHCIGFVDVAAEEYLAAHGVAG